MNKGERRVEEGRKEWVKKGGKRGSKTGGAQREGGGGRRGNKSQDTTPFSGPELCQREPKGCLS